MSDDEIDIDDTIKLRSDNVDGLGNSDESNDLLNCIIDMVYPWLVSLQNTSADLKTKESVRLYFCL